MSGDAEDSNEICHPRPTQKTEQLRNKYDKNINMLSAPIWRNGDVIIIKFTRNVPKETDMLNKST